MPLSNPLAWEIEKGFCMADLFQIFRIETEIKQLKMVPIFSKEKNDINKQFNVD